VDVDGSAPRPTATGKVSLKAFTTPTATNDGPALPALWRRLLLALVTLGTLAVGLFRIGRPAPWVDEAVTVLVVGRPWAGIPPLLQGADAPLVPYYLVAKAWAGCLAWLAPLTAVRTLSAVAAAVTAAALFTLASRLGGVLAGLLSSTMLVAMAGFSRYAQEARPYALLVMTATLAWLAWDCWRRPAPAELRRPASWPGVLGRSAAYLVSLMGSVVFHLFGLFQWPAQVIADLATPGLARAERLRRAVTSCVAMAVAALVVALPLGLAATHGTGAPLLIRMTPRQVWEYFLQAINAGIEATPAVPVLVLGGFAVVAVALRLRVARRYRRLVLIGVIWAVVPMVLSIAAAAVRPPLLRTRYWMPVVVPLALLAAVGLLVVAELVWRALVARSAGRRTAAVAAAVIVLAVVSVHAVLQVPRQLSIRAAGGHALSLQPALDNLDSLLSGEPDLPVTTTPYTRTTVTWAMRPSMIAGDVLWRLDQHGTEVWPVARDAADVAKRVEGHKTMIWIRARIAAASTTPTPKPTLPPKALSDLGFTVVSAERHGSWWVCILQR
jgi:mannosyltransferase